MAEQRVIVVLTPPAVDILRPFAGRWIRQMDNVQHFLCKSVDSASSNFYLYMVIEDTDADGNPADVDMRIPNAFVRGIMSAADLRTIGFVQ